MARPAATTVVLLLALGAVAVASEIGLTGGEGHPRSRFPLDVFAAHIGDIALDAAVRKAVGDWNAVFQEALGVQAFTGVERETDAQVVLGFEARSGSRLMGETRFRGAEEGGVIRLPVSIVIVEPQARGQTGRETLLYQVVAHELGHALGLAHVTDPRSVMCCVHGSIDFNDPAVRQVYVDARRQPDLRSVRAQLAAHYERFWKRRP